MSKAVTPDEVKKFHRLYEQYGSYAEVARRTGRSASTIGKYIRMAGMTKARFCCSMVYQSSYGKEGMSLFRNSDLQ